ncbi:hypothetical protein M9434_004947 [Picochlorum sp. BPE23]|nr:hypothetical protein M9434_004947 [Picochlorum sp. BPE23]
MNNVDLSLAKSVLDSWVVLILQCHSIVPMILIGTLWYLAAAARRREIRALTTKARRNGRPPDKGFPKVTILLPTRGFRRYSAENWKSILNFRYDGPLCYVFVVEDMNDPSVSIINELSETFDGSRSKSAKIVCAGRARHSSQKIHNLMCGIKHCIKSSRDAQNEYIMCMDDDVQPHSTFLEDLIYDLDSMPDMRVATAYPFDIPPTRDASIFSYATLAYHLPLSVGLAIHTKTRFVWGGCMAFRLEDMIDDRLGILSSWSKGGYSDDLTVAAQMGKLGLQIYCPASAVFPQWLPETMTFRQYWNYLRRQLFVLDTYSDAHNKHTNYALVCLLIYGSVGFVAPAVTIPLRFGLYVFEVFTYSSRLFIPQAWALSAGLFCIGVVYMGVALAQMIAETATLISILHGSDRAAITSKLSFFRIAVGFWFAQLVSPVCLAYTLLMPHIVWTGVSYVRKQGKVSVVSHSAAPCDRY